MKYKFYNQIIAYANRRNQNGCIISKKALKNCIKNKNIPISLDFNNKNIIGVTTDIRVEDDKLVADVMLNKKVNFKCECLSYAMFGKRKFNKDNINYKLTDCELDSLALIDRAESNIEEIENENDKRF